ncbi:MAG: chemotaxis protein CheD [bacterium]
MADDTLLVGMAEYRVARAPIKLGVRGLGSCVALALWDPSSGLGGLAHSMLPTASGNDDALEQPAKYCDSAVEALLKAIEIGGGRRERCYARLVGGANMFPNRLGTGPGALGERNLSVARSALRAVGLPILGEDCGGENGRSLELDCLDGTVLVWSAWAPPRRL